MTKDFNKLPKSEARLVSNKILNIIKMLKQFDTGKSFTVKELATQLDVSEKTVYRYLKTLKAAHVPVYRDPVTLRYSFSDGYRVGISDEYNDDDAWLIGDTSVEAIMLMEQDGRISYWNSAAENIYGYKRDEVLGKDAIKLLSPKRFHRANYDILDRIKVKSDITDKGISNEFVGLKKSGEEILVRLSFLSIMVKGQGKIITIIRELNEKEHKEYYTTRTNHHLTEHASDGVFIVDPNNEIVYWNSSSEHIFGYKKSEVIGESIFNKILPEDDNKEYYEILYELNNKKQSMNISTKVNLVGKRMDGTRLGLTSYILFKRDKIKNSSFLIIRIASYKMLE